MLEGTSISLFKGVGMRERNKGERHRPRRWCENVVSMGKSSSTFGGSSSVVEDHDGSTLYTGWDEFSIDPPIDRSEVSVNREGEFIVPRFGMRRGGSIGWLFEGGWLFNIEKNFNTGSADRIAGICIHFHIQKRFNFRVIKSERRMKIKFQIEIWNSRIRAACFILILMKRGKWWRDMKEYVYIYIRNEFKSISVN